MIDWKILAVTVPVTFVIFQTLSKFLPKGSPIFLVNAYAAFVGLIMMLLLHLLTSNNKSLHLSGDRTIWLAIGMGTFIALGNFGVIKAYSYGAPQSLFTIMFYVSLIMYGLIFGLLIWHEKLQPAQILGILIALGGIFLAVYPKLRS